jgi:hypothetical protein
MGSKCVGWIWESGQGINEQLHSDIEENVLTNSTHPVS